MLSIIDIVQAYVTHKKVDVYPVEVEMLRKLAQEGELITTTYRTMKTLSARLVPLVNDMTALFARLLRFYCFIADLQWLCGLASDPRTCALSVASHSPHDGPGHQQDLQRFRQQLAAESARRLQEFQATHTAEAFARMTLPGIARGYYKMHGGGTRFEAGFADVAKFSRAGSSLHVVRDGLVLGYAALCRAALRAQVEDLYAPRCAEVCHGLGVPVPTAGGDELNDTTMTAVSRSYECVVFRAVRRCASAHSLRARIEELRRECEEEEALLAAYEAGA